jgi:DNA-binding transcriptional LysR family regulator
MGRLGGAFARELKRTDFGFRCDSDIAQLAALRAGVGIGGCQKGIARRSKDLVPIPPRGVPDHARGLARQAPRSEVDFGVRLMFDWLAEGLSVYVKGKRLPAER